MTISDEAVEAAAIAIHRVNALEGAMLELDDYRPDARAALEAAAPLLMAQAWDEGRRGWDNYDDDNPYRSRA